MLALHELFTPDHFTVAMIPTAHCTGLRQQQGVNWLCKLALPKLNQLPGQRHVLKVKDVCSCDLLVQILLVSAADQPIKHKAQTHKPHWSGGGLGCGLRIELLGNRIYP